MRSSLTGLLIFCFTGVFGQVSKDTSEIVMDLSVNINEDVPEIDKSPIDRGFAVYGHYDKDYRRQKRLNSQSKYTKLKHRKTGKVGIMRSAVYYQHSKNQTGPKEKDFLLLPFYDKFEFQKGGIGVGLTDKRKYLLSNRFEKLLDEPVLRYEIQKSDRNEVTFVTVSTGSGRSVFNANGQLIVPKTTKGRILFRNDYLLLTRDDSLFVFDGSGKQRISPLYSENQHYMSLNGVITFVNNRGQYIYIDVDAGGDTIAIAQRGVYHRSDHTAITNGGYWQIIDHKGNPVQTPFEEIIKLSFYNQHKAALLVRENPKFDPNSSDSGNRFLYTFMDITTGQFGHVQLHEHDFGHYRLYSGQHFLSRQNSWLKVEVSQVSPNAEIKAISQVRFRGYVSLQGKFYPQKGKFHDLALAQIPGQKDTDVSLLKVASAIDKYGKVLRYGVTDLPGNVIVTPRFLEVKMVSE